MCLKVAGRSSWVKDNVLSGEKLELRENCDVKGISIVRSGDLAGMFFLLETENAAQVVLQFMC